MQKKKDWIKIWFFISYRHGGDGVENNNDFASGKYIAERELYRPLKRNGYRTYFDPKYKYVGEYPKRLEQRVKECKIFLWVLSKDCLICKRDELDWYYAEILWA